MSILSTHRWFRQKAVLWRYLGFTSEGRYVYDSPVEIKCRIEGGLEEYFAGNSVEGASQEILMTNEMYPFKEGDLIWYGKLVDLPAEKTIDPMATPEGVGLEQTWMIAIRKRVPNRRVRHTLYVGMLGPRTNLEGKY